MSPKLTKLNSSSESNSEQNEDSKEGCSTVKESLDLFSDEPRLLTPQKASLCSSSSAARVGRGGQTVVVVATIAGASNEPEVRSRKLTNSATGADEVEDSGEAGESEGEVQPDKILASDWSGKMCTSAIAR